MDIASFSAALSSVKTLLDFAKSTVAARDDAKLADALQSMKERIFDIQNAALQAQEKMSTMQDQIQALKDEKRQLATQVTELTKRQHERAQYDLCQLHPGSFVLEYIESDENPDPAHYICQPCMDNAAKKVVLQREQKSGRVNLVCHECKAVVFTGETYQVNLNTSAFR